MCSRYVAMACPLRLSGAPWPVGARGGGACVATMATLPEPAFCVASSVPVGSGSWQLSMEGLARVIFLGGATALIADIAVGHDLH